MIEPPERERAPRQAPSPNNRVPITRNDLSVQDDRCVVACSTPCPWRNCPIPITDSLDHVIGELIDHELTAVLP